MQTLGPSEIEIKNDTTNEIAEVLVVEYGANNAIIWIIGIPIGVLFMSVFGVYLLWTYYEHQKEDKEFDERRKGSEHVSCPSKSQLQGTAGIDMAEDDEYEENDEEDGSL